MTLKQRIRAITDDSWLVEDVCGVPGILTKTPRYYVLTSRGQRQRFYDTISVIKHLSCDSSHLRNCNHTHTHDEMVYIRGFPVKHSNPSCVAQGNLPLYAKRMGGAVYGAGYYCLRFPNGWAVAYCPKATTLRSFEYMGPFCTSNQARTALASVRQVSVCSK